MNLSSLISNFRGFHSNFHLKTPPIFLNINWNAWTPSFKYFSAKHSYLFLQGHCVYVGNLICILVSLIFKYMAPFYLTIYGQINVIYMFCWFFKTEHVNSFSYNFKVIILDDFNSSENIPEKVRSISLRILDSCGDVVNMISLFVSSNPLL